jgi:chromosome segregation ATPase
MKQQMLEAEVKELKAHIEALTAELEAVKEAYGDIEQYARRHCAEVEAFTAERDALKAQNEYQEKMIRQADVRGDYWKTIAEKAEADADALEADNVRLRKGCDCAMSEIRDYMQEIGGTLPLELAMGWLSAALNTGKETK